MFLLCCHVSVFPGPSVLFSIYPPDAVALSLFPMIWRPHPSTHLFPLLSSALQLPRLPYPPPPLQLIPPSATHYIYSSISFFFHLEPAFTCLTSMFDLLPAFWTLDSSVLHLFACVRLPSGFHLACFVKLSFCCFPLTHWPHPICLLLSAFGSIPVAAAAPDRLHLAIEGSKDIKCSLFVYKLMEKNNFVKAQAVGPSVHGWEHSSVCQPQEKLAALSGFIQQLERWAEHGASSSSWVG